MTRSTPRRRAGGAHPDRHRARGAATSTAAPAAKAAPQVDDRGQGPGRPAERRRRRRRHPLLGQTLRRRALQAGARRHRQRHLQEQEEPAGGRLRRRRRAPVHDAASNDNKAGKVWTLDPATGAPVLIGDTFKHEKKENPDGDVTYGFLNTPESCLDQLPEVHPRQLQGRQGDATPTRRDRRGRHLRRRRRRQRRPRDLADGRRVARSPLIPPAKVKVTAGGRRGDRPAGLHRRQEVLRSSRVPTDIEVGPDGYLYVTSLPGGPEDGSPGRQRPRAQGQARDRPGVKKVVGGLVSPTGRRGREQR